MEEKIYFEWAVEGAGEIVYKKKRADNTFYYVCEGSSMEDDENGEDGKTWLKEFISFENYWAYFIGNSHWYLYHIINVDSEIKEFIIEKLTFELNHTNLNDSWKHVIKRNIERLSK